MVKEYFKNPVFISVILLCFIFYSGVFTVPESFSFKCLLPQGQVNVIEGEIMNSPVKSASGKTYSAKFKTSSAAASDRISSASGIVTVLIPSEMVEVFFPGKLYTKSGSDQGYIFESGGKYIFEGSFSDKFFIVKSCRGCVFKKNITGFLDLLRAKSRLQFKRLMFKWNAAGGLLLALLCGAREYTNLELSENFRKAGLSHILALSGMHLSMFSAVALFLGNKIGRKKLTFIIRIIALFCFLWFAGFSPSLTRAFICSMLMILANIASVKDPDMILILCFSFILQTIMYPSDIKNYGFILSYAALLGILLTNKFFLRFYNRFIPIPLAASLSSSTGAQIFTLPVSLKLFGSFSPIGIIATSIISPLITIFIYSGLVLIIICLIIPPLADCSGILLNLQYTVIKYLVSFFAMAPRITI